MKKRFKLLISTILDEYRFIFVKQRAVLSFLITLPLIYPFIISSLYGAKQVIERPVVLIDHDNSQISRAFSIALDATQEVNIVERLDSIGNGWDMVKSQQAEAMIFIPSDFSSKIKQRKSSQIKMWMNSSNVLTYSVSYTGIKNVVQTMNAGIGWKFFLSKEMGSKAAKNRVFPIDEADKLLFHPSLSYGEFLVLGIFMVVIQQIILISLALSLGLRREDGGVNLHRHFPFTVIEGRILAHFLFYFIGVAIITFFFIPIFNWPIQNPLMIFFIFVVFVFSMAPISMIISVFMRDKFHAFQLLNFVSTPLLMISGYAWPFEQMPAYIRWIASIFPVTPALQAFRILTMKTDEMAYIIPYLKWMGIQFVIYLAIAIWLIRWLKRKSMTARKQKLELQKQN